MMLHQAAIPVMTDVSESLWKDYFDDPSRWWDDHVRKTSPRTPGFKHKKTKESLGLDCSYNPPWMDEEPRLRGQNKVKHVPNDPRVKNEAGCGFNIVLHLKACAKQQDLRRGLDLHAYIQEHKFLEKNSYVASALVNMYASCGALAKAQQVFDELPLPMRGVVAWTALIAGYAQQGQADEALKCFDGMQREGHCPDAVTFNCALNACGRIGAIAKGIEIHDKIITLGMLEKNALLGSTLVDMYARCGLLAKAQQVLNELPVQDVVAWTALITGYTQHGQGEAALKCFDRMQREGYRYDAVTFICALKTCGIIGAITKGEQIHNSIVRLGILESNVALGNTLIDMYARCGVLAKAQEVFDELPLRNVVTWNVLIAGHVQYEQGEEALIFFDSMQWQGQSPDVVTFTCVLKACGILGEVNRGEEFHNDIVSLGMLEKNHVLGNTLVDMYARCGALAKAQQVFDQLSVQNAVTWTALAAGYGQQGQVKEALICFEKMQSNGVRPDPASLVCALSACNHSGLLEQAETYFSKMTCEFGIIPDVEHYCCIVDVFGRVGNLHKALMLSDVDIEKMLCIDYISFWLALLGACLKWADVKIGRLAFEHAVYLDKGSAAAYIGMANIYIAAGMQKDADEIEVLRAANGA